MNSNVINLNEARAEREVAAILACYSLTIESLEVMIDELSAKFQAMLDDLDAE